MRGDFAVLLGTIVITSVALLFLVQQPSLSPDGLNVAEGENGEVIVECPSSLEPIDVESSCLLEGGGNGLIIKVPCGERTADVDGKARVQCEEWVRAEYESQVANCEASALAACRSRASSSFDSFECSQDPDPLCSNQPCRKSLSNDCQISHRPEFDPIDMTLEFVGDDNNGLCYYSCRFLSPGDDGVVRASGSARMTCSGCNSD